MVGVQKSFIVQANKVFLKALKARETTSRFKPYGKQNFPLRARRGERKRQDKSNFSTIFFE